MAVQGIKRAGYAILGGYELAYERARELTTRARKTGRKDLEGFYGDLTNRGERLVRKATRSKPAKRAAEGTRQASKQLKGATTSLKKAVGLEEEHTKTPSKSSG
jgi:hypothetical protein